VSHLLPHQGTVQPGLPRPRPLPRSAAPPLPPWAEYCSHGSLYELLREPDAAALLTWNVRLSMAMDAARGLLYLHSRSPPIIHRDIKSPNLLVDEGWHVKVGWQCTAVVLLECCCRYRGRPTA
jgi:hypothetical protein